MPAAGGCDGAQAMAMDTAQDTATISAQERVVGTGIYDEVECDVVVNGRGDIMLVRKAPEQPDPGLVRLHIVDRDLLFEAIDAGRTERLGQAPEAFLERFEAVLSAVMATIWDGELIAARQVPIKLN